MCVCCVVLYCAVCVQLLAMQPRKNVGTQRRDGFQFKYNTPNIYPTSDSGFFWSESPLVLEHKKLICLDFGAERFQDVVDPGSIL